MEITSRSHDTESGAPDTGSGAPEDELDEAALLRRAKETFRFGPDGRLLRVERPTSSGTPPATGGLSSLEAARAFVSHDPVLDECFEVALVFEAMAHFGQTAVGEPSEPDPAEPVEPVSADRNGVAVVADPADGAPPTGPDVVEPDDTTDDTTDDAADDDPYGDAFALVMEELREDVEDGVLVADDVPVAELAAADDQRAEPAAAADELVATNGHAPELDVDDLGDVDPPEGNGISAVPPARRRPMLEWPQADGRERRAAARSGRRDPVDALATVLGNTPDVELAFAQTLGGADAPMGMFRWPSGAALWTNAALDEWLLPGRPAERTLVAILDEWSQAHFLVRILPELLRRGRWRGPLRFAAASGRSEMMLVTLVGHEDDRGGTDAVSIFAMPVSSTGLSTPLSLGESATAGLGGGTELVVPDDLAALAGAVDDGLAQVVDSATAGASDQLFSALVQHVSDLIVVTDVHGRITFASPAAQALLDLAPAADGVRPNLLAIMHPDNRPTALAALARQPDEAALPPHPMRVLGADGSWRDLSGVLTDLTASPPITGYVLNARDVTDVVRAEQSITDQAYTDALTGLANRVRLLDRLEGNAHAVPPAAGALVILGLDHLRRIDTEHGAIGVETVLATVGGRLAQVARDLGPDVLAARLHSDEFAVLLPGADEVGSAVAAAGQVRLALRDPIRIGDQNVTVTASMGVATSRSAVPDDGFDEILARADLAMREAKARGRDRTVTYDERLGHRQQHRRGIDQQLRRAIDTDGLRIQFQPIVDLSSGRIVAAEALLRVRGDDGELLSPGAFVEAAESNGLISRLGAAVLRTTCEQATALDLKPGGFPISVNVSPRQIADPGFARRVLTVLDETGLAPDRLSLEITEGAFVGRDDASETNIISLRDEGVRLGLDEFGGDASLGYLRRFPLDFVKIDRRLIAGLGANYVDGTIVRATIELAHKLGLLTVAVGVEHDEQHRRLEQLGCDRAQGYLFGGAVSSVDLSAMLHGRT